MRPLTRHLGLVSLIAMLLALGGHVRAQDATPEATPLLSLAEQVGFDDPTLNYFEQQGGDHYLFDDQTWTAFGHNYRLVTVLGSSELYGTSGAVLLYQIDSLTPSLVWKKDFGPLGMAPIVHFFDHFDVHMSPPGDWNGDGSIEFAVLALSPCAGGFDCRIVYVYQLLPDSKAKSSLAGVIPPGYIVDGIEPEPDESVLIELFNAAAEETIDPPGSSCGSLDMRYYGWSNGVLVDVSAAHREKYAKLIGCNVLEFTTTDNPWVMRHNALALLQTFDTLGERKVGWTLVQNLLAQVQQNGRLPDKADADIAFPVALRDRYNSGQSFITADTVEPLPDYYLEPVG